MADISETIVEIANARLSEPLLGLDLFDEWNNSNLSPEMMNQIFRTREEAKCLFIQSSSSSEIGVASFILSKTSQILKKFQVEDAEQYIPYLGASILNYARLSRIRPEMACAIGIEREFETQDILRGLIRIPDNCIDSPGAIQLCWSIVDKSIVSDGDSSKFKKKLQAAVDNFFTVSFEIHDIGLANCEIAEIRGGQIIVLLHREKVKSVPFKELLGKGRFAADLSRIRPQNPDGVLLPWGVGTSMNLELLRLDQHMGGSTIILAGSGSGKSVLIQSTPVVAFVSGYSPRDLQIITIDGGNKTTLDPMRHLPYSFYKDKSFWVNVSDTGALEEIKLLLARIEEEQASRQRKINGRGYHNWVEFNKSVLPQDRIPALLIIFDEFSTTREVLTGLSKTSSNSLYKEVLRRIDAVFGSVCNQGRSAGVYFMGACPRPAKDDVGPLFNAVTNVIYGKFPARVAGDFRVPFAAKLPPHAFMSTLSANSNIFYSFDPGQLFTPEKWGPMVDRINSSTEVDGTRFDHIVTRTWDQPVTESVSLGANVLQYPSKSQTLEEDDDPWISLVSGTN